MSFQAVVTNELEDGDRQKAMKRLRVPPLGAAQVSIFFQLFGFTNLIINTICLADKIYLFHYFK